MKKLFAFFVLVLVAHAAPAPLVLISLDGFRWDYCALHPAETPNLRRLIREGVTARALIPVFPSNTFPNHYSIVTGLYPSHHGILNNLMFDPGRGEFFRYNRTASTANGRWWGGEPIWVTAIKQGQKAACELWPGSEAEIGGVRPTFWKPYDYRTPFEQRLEGAVRWLRDDHVSLLTFYLEEANGAGHRYGPDSPELAAALKLLDDRVGAFATRLAGEKIAANVIIVSDHGMTPCSVDQVVVLDDYFDLATVQIDFDETCAGLRPLPGNTVGAMMRALAALPPQARAYQAANLPARLHVDPENPRVPPVWIVPAEGWQIARRSVYNAAKERFLKGQHGYDPALPSMQGIFIAHGPAFKTGVQIDAVENIHVYNLLCAALGLKPAPNDGDDRLVQAALR
jgi:predicted AlkP superfamily pyrophosphatase or phosphodiesterase